jgi:hypothetical protein
VGTVESFGFRGIWEPQEENDGVGARGQADSVPGEFLSRRALVFAGQGEAGREFNGDVAGDGRS